MTAPEENKNQNGNGDIKKRNHVAIGVTLFFACVALFVFFLWFFVYRNWETTDDGYVGCDRIDVKAKIAGTPIAYYCDDTDLVKQGQLLVQYDTTDYALEYERQKVNLALTVQRVREQWQAVLQAEALVGQRKTAYEKAKQDFLNRQALVETKAIPREDFDHAQDDLKIAELGLKGAEHQKAAAVAAFGAARIVDSPLIAEAKIAVKKAFINLKYCSIYAPQTGYVAKRSVQVGQWFNQTQSLLSIIPLNRVWVDANFKETQLTDMRIGQKAIVKVDLYGSKVEFHGRVLGLQPGTGAVFSLLPPQNATGNWIKIVQRVPVRIELDPEEYAKHPLLNGLSCLISVDISKREGPMLAPAPSKELVASTDVFDISMKEVDGVIEQIIQDNLEHPKL